MRDGILPQDVWIAIEEMTPVAKGRGALERRINASREIYSEALLNERLK